jgi:hypothetical protein
MITILVFFVKRCNGVVEYMDKLDPSDRCSDRSWFVHVCLERRCHEAVSKLSENVAAGDSGATERAG